MPAFLWKKVYSNDLQHREPAKYRPILRSSQVTYAARLLRRMEGQGHGLLDCFMFLFPMCLRPTTIEKEEARPWFESEDLNLKQVSDIFLETHDAHDTPASSHYMFSEAAQQRLTAFKDGFRDISNVPPKSKMIGLLQRLSSALRMFTSSQKNWLQAENLGEAGVGRFFNSIYYSLLTAYPVTKKSYFSCVYYSPHTA